MAQERTSMRKIREILRLHLAHRMSRNAIARSARVSSSTAGDYLRRAEQACLTSWPQVQAMGDDELESKLGFGLTPAGAGIEAPAARAAPDLAWIHTELKRSKNVTLALLWTEYRAAHPDGYQYSQFCEHYRRWRGKLGLVMRQTHRAGEKTFVDYSGDGLGLTDPTTGARTSTQLFVGVLGASSYTYAEAGISQELSHWLTCHVHMFEFFGGVSAVTVPDNLKSGVKKPCFYDPEINPSYRDLAAHYGTVILPARVRKPRHKAKVEVGVQVAQRWILAVLRDRVFHTLSDMNAAIRECLERLNRRPMRHYGKSRRELWETLDRPALQPLPATPFELTTWKRARVNIDYHVEFERHFYSVPYALVHKRVDVRATAQTLEIFYNNRRVASHVRSSERGRHTTEPPHMPSSHRRYAEWTPSRMIHWAQDYGSSVGEVVKRLLDGKPHPEVGFRQVLGIIRLGKDHGKDRLDAAAAKALALGSVSYRTLKTMLANRMESTPLPPSVGIGGPSNTVRTQQQNSSQLSMFQRTAYVRGKTYYH